MPIMLADNASSPVSIDSFDSTERPPDPNRWSTLEELVKDGKSGWKIVSTEDHEGPKFYRSVSMVLPRSNVFSYPQCRC
jgi:hypothetical protein